MTHTDAEVFLENLQIWNRPQEEFGGQVFSADENVDLLVDDLFDHLMVSDLDCPYPIAIAS
jgi:hypothetical protein